MRTVLNVKVGDWVINRHNDYGLVKEIENPLGDIGEIGEMLVYAFWNSNDSYLQSVELNDITHIMRDKAEAKVITDVMKGVIKI